MIDVIISAATASTIESLIPVPVTNDLSARLRERLLEQFPEWQPLVASADRDGVVRVPSPVAGRALVICASAEEVTIALEPGLWHDHFFASRQEDQPRMLDAVVAAIDDIVRERRVIETRLVWGRPLWTIARRPGRLRRPLFGHSTVVSWTGALDAVLRR